MWLTVKFYNFKNSSWNYPGKHISNQFTIPTQFLSVLNIEVTNHIYKKILEEPEYEYFSINETTNVNGWNVTNTLAGQLLEDKMFKIILNYLRETFKVQLLNSTKII